MKIATNYDDWVCDLCGKAKPDKAEGGAAVIYYGNSVPSVPCAGTDNKRICICLDCAESARLFASMEVWSPNGIMAFKTPKMVKENKRFCAILHNPTPPYEIPYHRMRTSKQLLGWILHLCGKTWVTTEHISQLIGCAERHGVEVDMNS